MPRDRYAWRERDLKRNKRLRIRTPRSVSLTTLRLAARIEPSSHASIADLHAWMVSTMHVHAKHKGVIGGMKGVIKLPLRVGITDRAIEVVVLGNFAGEFVEIASATAACEGK